MKTQHCSVQNSRSQRPSDMTTGVRISFTCVLLGMILGVSSAYDQEYDFCPYRYRNIGCYNDNRFRSRPLTDQLPIEGDLLCPNVKDKDDEKAVSAWNNNIYDRVCKCAEKAKEGGYIYFGLEDCGECWTAKGNLTVNSDGLSDKCLTYGMEKCAFNSKECVGENKYTLYAYNLVPKRKRFGK